MKCKRTLFVLAAICLFLVSLPPGYCKEKPTCAILLFYPDIDSSETGESRSIAQQYADLLSRTDLFEVLDHKTVSRILKEKNVQDLNQACSNADCALAVGQALNVDYAVYGVIGHVGKLSSLETGLIDVAEGKESQHAVTDFEGSEQEFAATTPAENIQSLFGVSHIPEQTSVAEKTEEVPTESVTREAETPAEVQEPQPASKPKKFSAGPRVGVGASNDGIEVGGGIEVRFKQLSCQVLLNTDGFASGLSYYLNQQGSSPFVSVVGSYYDTENHDVDEIGRIYGLLAGYRLNINDHLDARIGVGAGYVNWDQTELNRNGIKDKDEEYIPIFELSMGYLF